jgi:DNA repair protein RecN (Recombination protein N)
MAEARRRFRVTTFDELIERAAEARAELAAREDGADPAAAAAAALAAAEARVAALAAGLRAERQAAAPGFAAAVAGELHDVGMGDGEFVCELRDRDPGATGADEVVFLVRANAGLPFAPVAETASGGELSRVALAIAAVAGGETLVFDEIDAGIGGETANAVGRVLQRLAARAQVITITHLPQIAALADRHFRVEKIPGDPTHTRIEQLGADERRAELERMLGGQEFLATVR